MSLLGTVSHSPVPAVDSIRVGIGTFAVGRPGTVLRTTLGSCVGILIRWPQRSVYGLAHAVLPERPSERTGLDPACVFDAVTLMLQAMGVGMLQGAQLDAILTGGGHVLGDPVTSRLDVHLRNAAAARCALEKRGICIGADHTGGTQAVSVEVDCTTGAYVLTPLGKTPLESQPTRS